MGQSAPAALVRPVAVGHRCDMANRSLRLATVGLVVALAACAGNPKAELRSDVEAITDAANARNAAELRARVADLEVTLADHVGRGELDATEADQIRAIAIRVAENAQLLQEPVAPPAQEEVAEPAAPDSAPAAGGEGSEDDRGKERGGGKGKGKGGD